MAEHAGTTGKPQLSAARGAAPRAFTLIEVLVVVAIIALLMAVLLPSLQNAREQARAAVCASRMKECLNGALMQLLEAQMRRERVTTNFGWGVFTLRMVKGQTEIFTCPNDPDPKPIPAVQVRILDGSGTTSADGVFNRYRRQGGGVWQVDVQDKIEHDEFGFDANNPNDIDLLLEFRVEKGVRSAEVTLRQKESALDFQVLDYRGRSIWSPASASVGQTAALPILWMSYGANAAAGLKNVKGNPVLLLEAGKPGIFPIRLGGYPADDPLAKPLRFRHGGRDNNPDLRGADYTAPGSYVSGVFPDRHYQPRERMNAGFMDGHVQRMHHRALLVNPNSALWRGTGRGTEFSF
jgi:prepilin-type N-terminal cleavage/methylation domain-containing protein/prepilin-type processing-associated H-X9-DG protein